MKIKTKHDYEVHPAAALFPLVEGERLQSLAASIKSRGLSHAIVMHDGMILDGRNRLRACELANVEPTFRTFGSLPCDDGKTPEQFVIDENLERRHLQESQRAMIGAELKKMLEPAAKERRAATLKQNANGTVRATLPERNEQPPERPRETAAKMVNVSPRSIQKASAVLERGTPELIAEVKAGEKSVNRAVRELPTNPQRAPREQKPKPFDVEERSYRLGCYLRDEFKLWPEEHWPRFAELIRQQLTKEFKL